MTRTFELIGQAGLPIKLLEEPHPSLASPSPHGMTTLMGAAHGADPNAADEEASTPIMFAAQHGRGETAALLEAAGAPD